MLLHLGYLNSKIYPIVYIISSARKQMLHINSAHPVYFIHYKMLFKDNKFQLWRKKKKANLYSRQRSLPNKEKL